MQLDRLVEFHKTMGDKTRIQMIALLQEGPLHGKALADKLGVTAPTISYHITKLREIDMIYQRRDKNTIYFYLHEKKLQLMAQAILLIGVEKEEACDMSKEEKSIVIQKFFDENGFLKTIPTQQKKKSIVLEYLVTGLEIGHTYSEREMNEHISQFHHDYATIRRELIMCHFMNRENGMYELNPKVMWIM